MNVRDYWSRVAALGCIVSRHCDATLHHAHEGSMVTVGVHRSIGRKNSDWLVIPLHMDYHVGRFGIDSGMGVLAWEQRFGRQVDMLDQVCRELNVNAWVLAGIDRCPWRAQSMKRCSNCTCGRKALTATPPSIDSIQSASGVLTLRGPVRHGTEQLQ